MLKKIYQFNVPILALSRGTKQAIALAVDISICILTVWLAFFLRLGYFVALTGPYAWPVVASLGLAIPIFAVSGLYRAIFRYSGWPAMMAVSRAMVAYGLLYASIFLAISLPGVPRTIGLIQPLLMFVCVGATRAMARFWLGGEFQSKAMRETLPKMLIYGAGSAGSQLASALANSQVTTVVGFLDDDERLHGRVLNGLTIYNPRDLSSLLTKVAVTDVLLALPSASRQRRNEILTTVSRYHLSVRTLPSVSEIATGKLKISDVRDLEIDDLLGRETVRPINALLNSNTQHKVVLVTGAGGSIGSELCRQILKCRPSRLLLVEMSEFALYQIHQELMRALSDLREAAFAAEQVLNIEIVPLLASVCNEARMHEIMSTWRPNTVYHTAAYKHVPLVEHNPAEGLRNNVYGTLVCAQTAAKNDVVNFVLISTDKAVRPTNIMGASKRLAEMVLQALSAEQTTIFAIVRFGNVLGSSGSVVPLFREQINSGGPVTLTHAEITRYFMTIPEAAQLVIQAGAMGIGGDVFVLDMGQPVRIADLARRMIELSGLSVRDVANPEGDIEIVVTGLRPGEKLYEELLIGDDPRHTQHPRIMRAHEEFLPWSVLQGKVDALHAFMRVNDVPAIRSLLRELVPGYQPNGDVVDWVCLAQGKKAVERL